MRRVFLQSKFFREDLSQYSNSSSFVFTTPTNTTPEIVKAAENALCLIFKTEYIISEAV